MSCFTETLDILHRCTENHVTERRSGPRQPASTSMKSHRAFRLPGGSPQGPSPHHPSVTSQCRCGCRSGTACALHYRSGKLRKTNFCFLVGVSLTSASAPTPAAPRTRTGRVFLFFPLRQGLGKPSAEFLPWDLGLAPSMISHQLQEREELM